MEADLFRVVKTIAAAHQRPEMDHFALLPGDILGQGDDGSWTKHAPGLTVAGFRLTPSQVLSLEAADVTVRPSRHGRNYESC